MPWPTSSKGWLNLVPALLRDPDEVSLPLPVYYVKKSIMVVGTFTAMPIPVASAIRKVNDFVIPHLGKVASALGAPFVGFVTASDLFDCYNEFNYYINEGLAKDWAKGQYVAIVGHLLLAPLNAIGVAMFLKATGVAASLGKTRFFSFVPYLATLTTPATILTSGVYLAFGVDGAQRYFKYRKKANHYHELFTQALGDIRETNPGFARRLAGEPQERLAVLQISQRVHEAARLNRKWKKNDSKSFQGLLDGIASASELLLQGAALLAPITAIPLIPLVPFAILAVGYSNYNRATTSKPELATLLR
jgi:hypothetical protein